MSKFNYIFNTNNNNYSWRHHILLHTLLPTRSYKYPCEKKVFHTLVRITWASIFVHNFNSVRKFYARFPKISSQHVQPNTHATITLSFISLFSHILSLCMSLSVSFFPFPLVYIYIFNACFSIRFKSFAFSLSSLRIAMKIKINNVNTSCSVFYSYSKSSKGKMFTFFEIIL